MAKAPVGLTVTTSGFFFTGNPVGWVHMSIYDMLADVSAVGGSAAAGQLSPGHGVLTGNLQASITPQLSYANRRATWTGRARVIQGARGYAPVRRYGAKVERKYKYMAPAARAAEAYAESRASRFSSDVAKGLNR